MGGVPKTIRPVPITADRIVEETLCQGVAGPAMDQVHHPATIPPRPYVFELCAPVCALCDLPGYFVERVICLRMQQSVAACGGFKTGGFEFVNVPPRERFNFEF